MTPHMLPAMNLCREGFQHDNDNQNVRVLPWPSKSPELNPIEHWWDDLDRGLRSRQPAPQALQNYSRFLRKNEENSARPYMSRRVGTVLQANGGHNIYWLWSDVISTVWTLIWCIWHFIAHESLNNQCAKFQCNVMLISVFKMMLKIWSKLFFLYMLRLSFWEYII